MNYFITYDILVSFKTLCRAPMSSVHHIKMEKQYNTLFIHTKGACVGIMNELFTTITC